MLRNDVGTDELALVNTSVTDSELRDGQSSSLSVQLQSVSEMLVVVTIDL